jgi:5-methylcytosine-specific restriction endonuclease McrA
MLKGWVCNDCHCTVPYVVPRPPSCPFCRVAPFRGGPVRAPAPPRFDQQAWSIRNRVSPRRKKPSPEVRRIVFARDGFACVACGATENLTVDHRLPRSRGGTNALENLQTMCSPCNNAKGNALPAGA